MRPHPFFTLCPTPLGKSPLWDNEGAAGIYCDAVEGTPAMAFSGEQGVLLYYEVLQVGWQIHYKVFIPTPLPFALKKT